MLPFDECPRCIEEHLARFLHEDGIGVEGSSYPAGAGGGYCDRFGTVKRPVTRPPVPAPPPTALPSIVARPLLRS